MTTTVLNEGVLVSSAVGTIDFVGEGVNVVPGAGRVTVTIPGADGGGGGSDVVGIPEGGLPGEVLTKTGIPDYAAAWVALDDVVGIPAGGMPGEVLAKAGASDYDVVWVAPNEGPIVRSLVEITSADSPYTVTDTDFAVCVDSSSGVVTVLLPPSPENGRVIHIKKASTDANAVTIDGNGKTLDAVATIATAAINRPSLMFIYSLGANDWRIL